MTDLAWRLLREGYDAVSSERAKRGGTDDFEARLLGKRAVVVRSAAGARAFYDESAVRRRGAVPAPLGWVLFGPGAVHTLDGDRHRDRKLMFVDVLAGDQPGPVVDGVETGLREAAAGWADCPGEELEVFPELVRVYGRSVLRWAGIDLSTHEEDDASRMLACIVDGFGFAGRAYARAVRARLRADRWAEGLVRDVRAGRRTPSDDAPLARIAAAPLTARTAGVELLNVLRPTVAVAWLGTFAALRLWQSPEWRSRLQDPHRAMDRLAFAQEVRRTTPFAPVLAARATREIVLDGVTIAEHDLLVLDVIGVHLDPGRWSDPARFAPERFLHAMPGAFDLVAQGGGHPAGHRCPGESLVLRILGATLQVLAEVDHEIVGAGPADRSRIPTLPAGRLRVRELSRSAHAGRA